MRHRDSAFFLALKLHRYEIAVTLVYLPHQTFWQIYDPAKTPSHRDQRFFTSVPETVPQKPPQSTDCTGSLSSVSGVPNTLVCLGVNPVTSGLMRYSHLRDCRCPLTKAPQRQLSLGLSFSANETELGPIRRHAHSGRPKILASVPPRIRLCVRAGTSQA